MMAKKNKLHNIRHGFFKTPSGWCAAAWTQKGLAALVLPRPGKSQALRGLHQSLPKVPSETWENPAMTVPLEIRQAAELALRGKPFRYSRFDLFSMTHFQKRVLVATCGILKGQVESYAWVARKAGSPKAFRAVGQALTRNPVSLLIPCHRVIASQGRLGGYGSGEGWKIRLLRGEGLEVSRDSDGYRVAKL